MSTITTDIINWRNLAIFDIYDLVMNDQLSSPELESLATALYEDKRGGQLCDLLTRAEFMDALERQMAA